MVRTISKTVKADSGIHKRLNEFLNQLTYLYNCGLQERIEAYRKRGVSISYNNQAGSLTEIRNDTLLSEFSKFSCPAQQNTLRRLDKAYDGLFKHKRGFPRYKKRLIRSFELDIRHLNKPKKIGRRTYLKIKGLGRFSFKGSMPDGCKVIRVVKSAIRVKVQFICKLPDNNKRRLDNPVGIDLGIINRVAFSDGELIKGIKLDRKELKRKQRAVSRSKKGSNTRKKKVGLLAREWERAATRETNSIHRLTSEIVKKCNNIIMEDLHITNMVKNPYLSRSITDQQWGRIKEQLTYKAESAGGKLNLVNPRNTSQICSDCGNKSVKKLPLSERVFNCIYCGYTEDRDKNASKNVLNKYKLMSGGKVVYKQFLMSAENVLIKRDRGNRGTLHSEQYA